MASGGFIAPFIQPDLKWDFRLERVKSINTKRRRARIVSGGLDTELPKELIFRVDYLGGDMRAIFDKAKSSIPSFGYPVIYALSTVVFLIRVSRDSVVVRRVISRTDG